MREICKNENSSLKIHFRCWFGEKHPSTGNETWKVEVCEENENHCYQVRIKNYLFKIQRT